jgi:hypothetical protein
MPKQWDVINQLIVGGMPPFYGSLSRPQVCLMGAWATGCSGKLNYAVHFDGVFQQQHPNQRNKFYIECDFQHVTCSDVKRYRFTTFVTL